MNIPTLLLAAGLLFTGNGLKAQVNQLPPVDKSPLDISYYPPNYPILKIQDKLTEPLLARVIFSRPVKSGRTILGDLVEYGKVWRMGANEATEIELFRDVKVMGNLLKKGRYTLFAIPNPEKWTIIFNRDTDTWGAFKYDSKKDALRIELKPETGKEPVEVLCMYFEKNEREVALVLRWDDLRLSIPFNSAPTAKGKG